MKLGGLGIDIIETKKFSTLGQRRNNHFLERNFSKEELSYCFSFRDTATHLAGTFAAKEAVVKTLKKSVLLSLVEIKRNKNNQPSVWIRDHHQKSILISISHTKKIAMAIAIRQ